MKPNLTNIKNIVFDLGMVIVNLDFEASINAFRKLGLDTQVVTRQQAYSDPVFYELETGRTTAENFRLRVRQILNNPNADDRQIDNAWCAMIRDVPEKRVDVVKKLAENFRLFLYSNTNAIHIAYFNEVFRKNYGFEFSTLFERVFYSHEINERKPDLSSYRKITELAGIDPKETLFIDDLERNIIGAQKAGLNTFWLKYGMDLSELF